MYTSKVIFMKNKFLLKMKDNEQNIFEWLKTEQKSYKGAFGQRQNYNITCLGIIAEAIKMFPHYTFKEILTYCGLFNDIDNVREESNVTLGYMIKRKKQYEHWNELGICDRLHGEINETLSDLYEYHE